MAVEADYIVDRQRLKRGLFLWRVIAVASVVVLIAVGFGRLAGFQGGDYIARVSITGIIVDDPERSRIIRKLAFDQRAKAVILHIDSPGGTVVGGEALYKALRVIGDRKPVVAVMGQMATSAGYMVALAADRILAHEGTITGSIGVILQTTEITGLLKKIGVSAEAIKSGPLKSTPSPFEPMTPASRRAAQNLVDEMHAMFVGLVAKRRKISAERARQVSDGRVFTGRSALSRKLVDGIGSEPGAIVWLNRTRKVKAGLPVRDVPPRRPLGGWVEKLDSLAGKVVLSERLTLDGLISVWHPSGQ